MLNEIVVGTRGSKLALIQTNWVIGKLKLLNPDYTFKIIDIKTKGDKILDVALSKIGDKGLFTRELDDALLNGAIDLAVHSMKDIPTALPDGTMIGAICKRADPRDVVISRSGLLLNELPKGAKVGTSSLRRTAQLLNYRPDFKVCDLRGNIDSRLSKLEIEKFDAIILAAAGILRMEWENRITEYISTDICLPAVGQGALGVEIRENDEKIFNIVQKLNHPQSEATINAERAMLKALEGGCQIPIGALGNVNNDTLQLQGVIASPDGKQVLKAQVDGDIEDAVLIGERLANILIDMGGKDILNKLRMEK